MPHANTIFITNLFDLEHYVRTVTPTRLISIIQPELQPDRPPPLEEYEHHRCAVHDIVDDQPFSVLIDETHVRELTAFVDTWEPNHGALMTHCYAGVSRSTAAALIAAYMKTGDAFSSATALRAAAPHAMPNRRVIELADGVLGANGSLIEAREAMGPPANSVLDTPLAFFRIGEPESD